MGAEAPVKAVDPCSRGPPSQLGGPRLHGMCSLLLEHLQAFSGILKGLMFHTDTSTPAQARAENGTNTQTATGDEPGDTQVTRTQVCNSSVHAKVPNAAVAEDSVCVPSISPSFPLCGWVWVGSR